MILGLAVATLAVVGAVVRVGLSERLNPSYTWPVGTLLVNISGSLFLGMLVTTTPTIVTIFGVGFLGSLTTFSTVAVEVDRLRAEASASSALGYLGSTLVVCVGAAWIGLQVA